ncbi:anaerobic sulfite reductase subunit A [Desulfitispora alkaliphila]|uniref:4Fe-4S dicluster domain-containing protein n=1 Tax=Desulfitispora alkaliphila TaxID=622674 RepID=UPI003D206115
MAYEVKGEIFNTLLSKWKKKYKIYAPKRLEKRGRFSDTDLIRYGEIEAVEEIVWSEKSHFSPKEIVHPITQTLLYFTEDQYQESLVQDKKIMIFLRPCDINGFKRLDTIFLNNGPYPDYYYERLREKVKFVMIECKESFDNCFCVSMDANFSNDYNMAVRFNQENLYFHVKDDVACGRCNVHCITCSCFTTQDITYDDNPKTGERRRIWASCHVDNFTTMAGGHEFREDYGSRMRFKTMHKIYDYKKRFGEHMCVGCGRCDDQCPEYISFSNCINKVHQVLKEEKTNEQ